MKIFLRFLHARKGHQWCKHGVCHCGYVKTVTGFLDGGVLPCRHGPEVAGQDPDYLEGMYQIATGDLDGEV